MVGKIIKIDDLKRSRNEDQAFKRVYFKVAKTEGERPDFAWAKTDLVPTFRNYARWKDLLKVGNFIGGVELKDEVTVNADCNPYLISEGNDLGEDLILAKQAKLL